MNALLDVWQFTRDRLGPCYQDLNDEQLRWRAHPGAHSIGELLYHMAGAEHYWAARMTGKDPHDTPWGEKLDRAVREGFLLEGTRSPFTDDDMKLPLIEEALAYSAAALRPILENPSKEQIEMKMISPLGPEVTGYGGFLRIVQHAGYHAGQIWIFRMDPRFPNS